MALFSLVAIALGVVAAIWFALERREKNLANAEAPRLARWRLGLAAVAGLLVLFSGGCSLFLVPSAMNGEQYVSFGAILVLGGGPLAFGVLVLWLTLRR